MDLAVFAWISLAVAFVCAVVIALDEVRRPQKMSVMNIVWPVSALYFSVIGLWAYFHWGRARSKAETAHSEQTHDHLGGMDDGPPTVRQVAVGTSHCGAGCTIADVITEFAIAATGLTLFGAVIWTDYLLDFVVAWLIGIAFQYFAIKPMRQDLSAGGAILAAIKADTLSITAFQVGMYAFMALVYFKLFTHPHLTPFDPRYWLMMQIAMICGYATSFPMNRFLIQWGLKEKM